ncbi:MAG: hypothetical protein BGO27_00790 [Alphaproteobacteria bacterium 33-17]|nr:MAG: hypothetical protein BGO27_00790 [Alphaproteobacteria bacterium 33-17]
MAMTIIMVGISEYNKIESTPTPNLLDNNDIFSFRKTDAIVPQDNSVSFTVQNGDTLRSILANADISENDAGNIIKSLKKVYDPSKISIGQNISIFYDDFDKTSISAVKFSITSEKTIELSKTDEGFSVKERFIPLVKNYVHVTSKIEGSLFGSTQASDVPSIIAQEFVKQFSYDVDFQRDIHEGDSFDLVYERYYDAYGNYARDGKPIYMSLNLAGEVYKLYYFEGKDGKGDYYSESGASVRKELLKTPINASRISSGFGLRKHPVLGYSKMHKGVDFAAPIGTPIFAAGDGTIIEMGRKGTYGNYIKLKHGSGYSTAYAHCSKFKKNLKLGTRVQQGEVIAYVGATGRVTGPHLHFEVLKGSQHINPVNAKFASNNKVNVNETREFKRYVQKLNRKLISMPSHTEISADSIKGL